MEHLPGAHAHREEQGRPDPLRRGHPVIPREWFLVPLFVVDEAIEKIRDGTITSYTYNPKTASLARAAG